MSETVTSSAIDEVSLPTYLRPYVDNGISHTLAGQERLTRPVPANDLTDALDELVATRTALQFDVLSFRRQVTELDEVRRAVDRHVNRSAALRVLGGAGRYNRNVETLTRLTGQVTSRQEEADAFKAAMMHPDVRRATNLADALGRLDARIGGLREAVLVQSSVRAEAARLDPVLGPIARRLDDSERVDLRLVDRQLGHFLYEAERNGASGDELVNGLHEYVQKLTAVERAPLGPDLSL